MEVSEHHTALGKAIEIRCLDFAAEAAQVGPTHVVGDDKQDVWSLVDSRGSARFVRGVGTAGRCDYQAEYT